MTRHGVFHAANTTFELMKARAVEKGWPKVPDASRAHLEYMLQKMAGSLFDDGFDSDKLNRWLGYIQGVGVCSGLITLEEEKEINKTHEND